ncbi:MAG: hypothetical protein IT186_03950 [Acidobacteria bacterium]|nr:hypothetical protein [Acidobacteriota bacterium]
MNAQSTNLDVQNPVNGTFAAGGNGFVVVSILVLTSSILLIGEPGDCVI